MATQPVQGPASSNAYLDALQWGGWRWEDPAAAPGDPVVIRYYVENYQNTAWFSYERAALIKAFNAWSAVANISFVETNSAANAQLIERQVGESLLPGTLGEHGTPDSAANGPEFDGPLLLGSNNKSYGYFNWQAWSQAGLKAGGYDFVTLVHELGHGLGLAHPHDDGGGSGVFPGVTQFNDADRGTYNLNQGIYTVMSYNDGWQTAPNKLSASVINYGYVSGPMAFDIAAIQDLYGANTTKNGGDNVYTLPGANRAGTFYSCIWDTGGTDTIAYSGSRNVIIDLRAATLDLSPTGGGVVSYASGIHGGFTIANSVEIEIARGGSGNDKLRGAAGIANTLIGAGGNDTLIGSGGGDHYIGGRGIDTVNYSASGSLVIVDLLTGTGSGAANNDTFATIEIVIGTQFGDQLFGNGGANRLYGGLGADIIEGGAGADLLDGGAGVDTVSFEHASTAVRVNLGTFAEQNTAGGGFDRIARFENVTGSSFGDTLVGNAGENELDGGAGDDSLSGGKGLDTLTGGLGADRFMFNTSFGAADVITDFEASIDHIVLDNDIYTAIGAAGALDASKFVTGAAALDANDRIVYDSTTGYIIYDSNGSDAGGTHNVAYVGIGLALSASDFVIIA